jgi:hypothetical protein
MDWTVSVNQTMNEVIADREVTCVLLGKRLVVLRLETVGATLSLEGDEQVRTRACSAQLHTKYLTSKVNSAFIIIKNTHETTVDLASTCKVD